MIDRLLLARRAVEVGGRVALRRFADAHVGDLHVSFKPDGSLVTDADIATERAVMSLLRAGDPAASILSEETGGTVDPAGTWVVDPIDGTENYSRGIPVWGVMLAWLVDGIVEHAAISAPALHDSWWASRNRGAFSTSGPLRVSSIENLNKATCAIGGVHEFRTPRDEERVMDLASRTRNAWGFGNFWGHTLLAAGALDIAISLGTQLWDIAAPSLIVSEAGGRWASFEGGSSLDDGSLVSTNEHLFETVVRILETD